MYAYTQCAVLRSGFEVDAKWQLPAGFEAEIRGEYLYSRQMSGDKKGYALPFSPPWAGDLIVKYTFLTDGYLSLDVRVAGRQDDIVPPEKPTDGYCTLNLATGKEFQAGDMRFKVGLQVENLLNRRYYDHTSYYRLIGIPEPGINAALLVGIEF